MPSHISTKLWKRSCGLSRWFLYESVPSDAPEYSEAIPSNGPIKLLPVEVLGEIFSWTLGDWGTMTDDASSLNLEPLTISHVCGHWRAVSLSMPMLWATIWIDRPRAPHIPMVKLWLERSRNCPLSINLRQTDPKSCLAFPTSNEHDLTDEIFGLLIPQLHRWQAIEFILKTDTQQSLLSIPEDGAVALEHVALHLDSWDTTGAELLQATLYSRPSVRSVHLSPASNRQDVAWTQLTHLDAELECTVETCLGILAACPTLSSAKFTCSSQPDWAHTPFKHSTPYLTLPSLVDLTIKASRVDLSPFFTCLTLPALRSLALEYCHVPRAVLDHQALHALLERSSCGLEVFSLHETARIRDEQRHIAFLRSPHMASVADLELKVDMTDELVKFLTLGGEGDPQLVNLTALALSDCRGDHISDELLFALLSSRSPSTGPAFLRSVELQLRLTGHTFPVETYRDQLELRVELLKCFCK